MPGGRSVPFDEENLRARLHGIYTGELQAMEAAGRTLFDFPDAPWEFQLDMARQVWDESRHSEIFQRLVEYMGGHAGDYVETEILWRCTQAMDPAARVAGINRGLEGLACDVFDQLIRIAQRNGSSSPSPTPPSSARRRATATGLRTFSSTASPACTTPAAWFCSPRRS